MRLRSSLRETYLTKPLCCCKLHKQARLQGKQVLSCRQVGCRLETGMQARLRADRLGLSETNYWGPKLGRGTGQRLKMLCYTKTCRGPAFNITWL